MRKLHTNSINFWTENPGFTKERIYGSITLLATSIGLFSHFDEHMAPSFVAITIFTTTIGIWLAAIFSEVIAEKLAENFSGGENPFTHHDKKELFANSLGILHSAFFPIVLSILAHFKIISLHTALVAMMTMMSLQLIFFIILATLHRKNSFLLNIILISAQLFFFLLIIYFKTAH